MSQLGSRPDLLNIVIVEAIPPRLNRFLQVTLFLLQPAALQPGRVRDLSH